MFSVASGVCLSEAAVGLSTCMPSLTIAYQRMLIYASGIFAENDWSASK